MLPPCLYGGYHPRPVTERVPVRIPNKAWMHLLREKKSDFRMMSGLKVSKGSGLLLQTTHQNVIKCSSVDWKTLREFLCPVRSASNTRIIRPSKTINLLH
ncbi:hypothetical protein TNCV_4276491 [Trichonephila clavipes]|nr:hypothetical protein TNCV_4276491 [Trichonephila clavipes]